jgi:hypothetical protein
MDIEYTGVINDTANNEISCIIYIMTKIEQTNLADRYSLPIAVITTLLTVAFWISAAFMPAYTLTENSGGTYFGIMCFFYGFLTPFYSLFLFIVWTSNFIGIASLVLIYLKKHVAGTYAGIMAFIFALGSLIVNDLPKDENGSTYDAMPEIGVYLWIASIFIIAAGNLLALKVSRKSH